MNFILAMTIAITSETVDVININTGRAGIRMADGLLSPY
jgi:hypothetical protein